MKFNWTMPAARETHYRRALKVFTTEIAKGNPPQARRQLEHAQILGHPWFVQHSHVHSLMLKFGIEIKSRKAIPGQIPWHLLGGLKSFVGKIFTGNTGGANVPPYRKLAMPQDLKNLLRPYLKPLCSGQLHLL